MLLEVSDSEYKDFYREIERKKYCKKLAKNIQLYSIEEIEREDRDFRKKEIIDLASIDLESEIQEKEEIDELRKALLKLNYDEYNLIQALFFRENTIREYANILKKPFSTIEYQKEKILKKLKKLLKF